VPERSGRRVALLGGSFDPPHVAHVLLATYVLLRGEVDEVLVVPVFEHAFGKRLAPFEERVELCELAFAALVGVTVSRVEAELPSPSRTLVTLEHLTRARPDAHFRLVVGSDVLIDAHKWYAFDEVTRRAPLLIVPRPGYPHPGAAVLPDVSSTSVRELLARRDPAAIEELRGIVPRACLDVILAKNLYTRGC
jgi:nicotinate-nucleotide adenylyltransferase